MKSPCANLNSHAGAGKRAMALVLVLGMLVLIVMLVVAFISSVQVELSSAKSYAGGSEARSLADTAVNIVVSQIEEATSEPTLAWASQPGMIRTYDSSGNPAAAYKLYSSGRLMENGGFNAVANLANEVPGDWWADPNRYVDLNKPVAASGVLHYPIISPAAVNKDRSAVTGDKALDEVSTPIEGCFLDSTVPAAHVTPEQPNPVPFPVQWLYVLKDGSVAAMDPATKKILGAGDPLPDGTPNTIVGRIAFWADDETCKLNVNTASEGTFWDRPWTDGPWLFDPATSYEKSLVYSMPLQNEYQRFPGHPAMNCLSVIFPQLPGESEVDYKERIYGITPRIVGGGSTGGTRRNTSLGTAALTPDSDRLFASVDEFIFSAGGGAPRSRNPKGPADDFTSSDIEKTRFFLTATSRSPEVNLFNKPRITLWPLQANTDEVADPKNAAERNAKDKLIAFCSTIGDKPFYFQRFGTAQSAAPGSQSPTLDWNNVPRNQDLYRYLQSLTRDPIPGLGGKLSGSGGKYPDSVRDQILTEMFDFIRSSVNTFSTGGNPTYNYARFNRTGKGATGQLQVVPLALPNGTKGFGRFPTITQAVLVFYGSNPGDPAEMRCVLLLAPFNPTPGPPPWSAHVRYRVKGLENLTVTPMGGTPGPPISLGFPADASNLVTALDGELNQTALTGLEQCTQYRGSTYVRPKTLGPATFGAPDEEQFYPFFSAAVKIPTPKFNMSSADITIEIYPGSAAAMNSDSLVQTIGMNFPATTLGLCRPVPHPGPPPHRYYDYNYRFAFLNDPNGNKNKERYGILEDGNHTPLPLITTKDVVRSAEPRYGGPAAGDFRVFAGLQKVPDSYFEGRGLKDPPKGTPGSYSESPVDIDDVRARIHSLRIDGDNDNADPRSYNGYYFGYGTAGDPRGKLLANATYRDLNRGDSRRASKACVVPRGLNGAYMDSAQTIMGDWDTGPGWHPDGPFINKADEGNVGSRSTGGTTAGLYYDLGGYLITDGSQVAESGASFSPNRQIASAVSFGSLPSGINPADRENLTPWRTLLFCRNPAAGSRHPGFGASAGTAPKPPYLIAPDHAFLDFFTMPIVEPYAISEPFSTAGKVNMNYQIVPFTYLTRSSAVRAVLKSTNMMAIPQTDADIHKYYHTAANRVRKPAPDYRYTINPDEREGTLAGFQERFAAGDIFRSASEICDIWLVPGAGVNARVAPAGGVRYQDMAAWWDNYQLTGDNLREGPYGHIYPRLTTKSNTFTVHVISQSLVKSKRSAPDEMVSGMDLVSAEFRGSFIVQRTLDPNSDSLVKPGPGGLVSATELDAGAMVGPYKYRIIVSKRFAP